MGSELPAGPIPNRLLPVSLMLSQPLSRGIVHIQSANASEAPVINPHCLSKPIDLEVMTHHLKHIETIVQAGPMSELLASPWVSTANVQATVDAFAKKAADLIKIDYGLYVKVWIRQPLRSKTGPGLVET